MVIAASTFASYNLDETVDALLDDVDFLNDHTKYEILRVLVVSKTDLLSEDELENILIQVHSIAEDKGIDFVTTSSRTGTRSIRDLFKFAAQRTVMNTEYVESKKKALGEDGGAEGAAVNVAGGGGAFEADDDQMPEPQRHSNAHERQKKMDNLFTTTSY